MSTPVSVQGSKMLFGCVYIIFSNPDKFLDWAREVQRRGWEDKGHSISLQLSHLEQCGAGLRALARDGDLGFHFWGGWKPAG